MYSLEEIKKELNEVLSYVSINGPVAYEITSSRYGNVSGKIFNTSNSIKVHDIKEETTVSYVTTFGYKINKKKLTYTDSGMLHKVSLNFEDLAKEVFVHLNKYQIMELLRFENDFDLWCSLYKRLKKC